jgi:hypothetical protein
MPLSLSPSLRHTCTGPWQIDGLVPGCTRLLDSRLRKLWSSSHLLSLRGACSVSLCYRFLVRYIRPIEGKTQFGLSLRYYSPLRSCLGDCNLLSHHCPQLGHSQLKIHHHNAFSRTSLWNRSEKEKENAFHDAAEDPPRSPGLQCDANNPKSTQLGPKTVLESSSDFSSKFASPVHATARTYTDTSQNTFAFHDQLFPNSGNDTPFDDAVFCQHEQGSTSDAYNVQLADYMYVDAFEFDLNSTLHMPSLSDGNTSLSSPASVGTMAGDSSSDPFDASDALSPWDPTISWNLLL